MTQPPGPQGPYEQYPGWGQPQQPQPGWRQPQQPAWGQQQPGQYPPAPQPYPDFGPSGGKKKSKLPWILGGIGALVVIGGAILLIVLLGGGGGKGSTPQETAEAFATAFNERDVEGVRAVLCDADLNGETGKRLNAGEAFKGVPEGGEFRVARVEETGPGKATAYYSRFLNGKQEGDEELDIELVENNGEWEICTEADG